MSLFARIMSHGFGLAVVALLAIGLIYRGELFPGMELPAFLQVERLAKDSREAPADSGSDAQPAEASGDPAAVDRDTLTAGELPETSAEVAGSPSGAADTDSVAVTSPAAPLADVTPPAEMPPPQADIPQPTEVPSPQVDVPPPAEVPSPPAGVPSPQADVPSPAEVPPPEAGVPSPDAASLSASGAVPATTDEAAMAGGQVTRGSDAVVPPAVEAVTDAPVAAEEPVARITRDMPPSGDVSSTPSAVVAPATSAPSTAAVPAVQQADEAAGTDSTPVAGSAPVAGDSEAVPASAAVAGSAAPTQEQAAAPVAADAQAQSPYKLLAAAREAYWLRDYVTAEQKYQAMIDLDPQNPDGYGELGNMYFSQGKWDRAAEVYFEAGKRLADEGLFRESRQIVDVLRGLQGPQADELEQYIAARAGEDQ